MILSLSSNEFFETPIFLKIVVCFEHYFRFLKKKLSASLQSPVIFCSFSGELSCLVESFLRLEACKKVWRHYSSAIWLTDSVVNFFNCVFGFEALGSRTSSYPTHFFYERMELFEIKARLYAVIAVFFS